MKKSRLLASVIACVFGLTALNPAWAVPVTVTSNSLGAYAYDDATGQITDFTSSIAIPTTETLTATTGNSSNTTDIYYSGDSEHVTLSVDMSHAIDNADGIIGGDCCDYAQTANNSFLFTSDVNATYSISGFYEMSGPVGTQTKFHVFFQDITNVNETLFEDNSDSYSTANESFVLGILDDGDSYNSNQGSLTGNLVAGHNYSLFISAFIHSRDLSGIETAVTATADGNVTLNITTVPLPTSIWLFYSGLLGLIGISRRKKTA